MTAPGSGFGGGRRRLTSTVATLVGVALLFVAAGQAVAGLVELFMGGDDPWALFFSAAITAGVGGVLWTVFRVDRALSPASVFGAVLASWVAASMFGALPYWLSGLTPAVDDAIFESVSGFSCTGSTILTEEQFSQNNPGVMLWRQMTQWYGGMGMIVLAVAVLPFLGVGGLELVRAEAPGPSSDRLAPRVSETAKRLWMVYVGFTLLSAAALVAAGMSLYDGVAHSFSLVSTGGFSPYVESIGYYDSVLIEGVIIVGMVLGAMNFALHWRLLRHGLRPYRESSELRAFLVILVSGIAVVALINSSAGVGADTALRNSAFNVSSLLTSTGYGNASPTNPFGDYVLWVAGAQLVLLSAMVIGGMTGSTSGGLKVLRVTVLARSAGREVLRARHPRAQIVLKEGRVAVSDRVVANIAGFGMLYFLITAVGVVVIAALGADLVTSVGGVVSAMGNMGPGLGESGPTSNFLVYSRPARMVLAALMLVGRLEIFPVMITGVVLFRRLGRGVRGGARSIHAREVAE